MLRGEMPQYWGSWVPAVHFSMPLEGHRGVCFETCVAGGLRNELLGSWVAQSVKRPSGS